MGTWVFTLLWDKHTLTEGTPRRSWVIQWGQERPCGNKGGRNTSVHEQTNRWTQCRIDKSSQRCLGRINWLGYPIAEPTTETSIQGCPDPLQLVSVAMGPTSTDGRVYWIHVGILLSLEKEGNSSTCFHIGESWGHYAEQNKPLSKSQVSQAKPNIEYRVALLRDEKNCGGEWCWWSHNSMNILNTTELYT